MGLQVVNIDKWIAKYEEFFVPPVCNKMMHNNQLLVMFVGGPNVRKDYHIEEGEELFYMVKGDMCLKVVEKGLHKDIIIKEGEMFLLPARIPHSPQRQENTIGIVIERKRAKTETDVLRYYVDGSMQVLYEKSFHCVDLGTQLGPIIKEFFASEPFKTGIPDKRFVLETLPYELNKSSTLSSPFLLDEKLSAAVKENRPKIFSNKFQFDVEICVGGVSNEQTGDVEQWLWQISGSSNVKVKDEEFTLHCNDSLLIPSNSSYTWTREDSSKALRILQDVSRK